MPRKPTDVAHINLRIRESLRRKLEREAERHATSLNNEIRLRLEDSFQKEAKFELDTIRDDMETVWARYGDRFLRLELQDQFFEALAKEDASRVLEVARTWLASKPPKGAAR